MEDQNKLRARTSGTSETAAEGISIHPLAHS